MKRCVIVGGADIGCYDRLRSALHKDDFVVYCDSGLKHCNALKREPDLIVGDFDSYENPHLAVETIVLPRVKDDTDTVFAVKEMLKRGYEDFLLIGVVGGRLDHTLGNVSILMMLTGLGKQGTILDDYSEMEVISNSTAFVPSSFSYFSLLNISGTARGIDIRNAKYPLTDAEITCEYAYGVSNEVLPGYTAEITIRDGSLLLIKVF